MSTKRTGVNQPNMAGSNYPFVGWSDLSAFITDIRVGFDPKRHKAPFTVHACSGFTGETLADRPILLVKDANNEVVFDSLNHKPPVVYEWAGSYRGFRWADCTLGMQLITAIEEAGALSATPTFFPQEIDIRACSPRQVGVTTFRVENKDGIELANLTSGNTLAWLQGFNAQFIPYIPPASTSPVPGFAEFRLQSGDGLGRYKDCPDNVDQYVRSMSGAKGNSFGDLKLQPDKCLRFSPRIKIIDNVAKIVPGFLNLADDCKACCDCPDYLNVYKAISRTARSVESTARDVLPMIASYNDAQSFIADKLSCLGAEQIMRVNAAGSGPGQMGVAISLLNPTAEQIKAANVRIKVYQVLSNNTAGQIYAESPLDYGYLLRNGVPNTHLNVKTDEDGEPVVTFDCIQPGEAATVVLRLKAEVTGLAQVCVEIDTWNPLDPTIRKPKQTCVLVRINEVPETE